MEKLKNFEIIKNNLKKNIKLRLWDPQKSKKNMFFLTFGSNLVTFGHSKKKAPRWQKFLKVIEFKMRNGIWPANIQPDVIRHPISLPKIFLSPKTKN